MRTNKRSVENMTFSAFRDEYETDVIGPRLWKLLRELAENVARRYPPLVYNNGQSWNTDSYEDLSQDVVVDLLIGEGQLEFIFEVSGSVEDIRRLLVRQIKRALSRRRVFTVVDRLISRIRKFAVVEPFSMKRVGREDWITFDSSDEVFRNLSDDERAMAIRDCFSVTRLVANSRSERASMVYSTLNLKELVSRIVSVGGGVGIRDLSRILESLLTPWLASILGDTEELDVPAATDPSGEMENAEMRVKVKSFALGLTSSDLSIILSKAQGIADQDVASQIGRSRPWVAERKKTVLNKVSGGLMAEFFNEQLDEVAEVLLEEVSLLLGEEGS
jgi:hypothetical protein